MKGDRPESILLGPACPTEYSVIKAPACSDCYQGALPRGTLLCGPSAFGLPFHLSVDKWAPSTLYPYK